MVIGPNLKKSMVIISPNLMILIVCNFGPNSKKILFICSNFKKLILIGPNFKRIIVNGQNVYKIIVMRSKL